MGAILESVATIFKPFSKRATSNWPTLLIVSLISCRGFPKRDRPFSIIRAKGVLVDLHKVKAASKRLLCMKSRMLFIKLVSSFEAFLRFKYLSTNIYTITPTDINKGMVIHMVPGANNRDKMFNFSS